MVVTLIKACHGDRRTAFTIVTLFWMVGGALLLLLVCTVDSDERRVQDAVRASLLRTHLALASADPADGVAAQVLVCEACGKTVVVPLPTEAVSAVVTVRFDTRIEGSACDCHCRRLLSSIPSSADSSSHYGTLDNISVVLEDSHEPIHMNNA